MGAASRVADTVDVTPVAVILARGLGTRMRSGGAQGLSDAQAAAAAGGQKGMMPLPGQDGRIRPFLDYGLSALADAGFADVILVVPPPTTGASDPLRAYYTGEGRPARVCVTFAVQQEPRGTADALVAAAEAINGRPFVVVNADNVYDTDDLRALYEASGPALPVYARDRLVELSGIPAERVGAFALLTIADGTLCDVVEKPGTEAIAAAGPDAAISMNCWRGDDRLLQACRDVPISPRGEFELPAAIRLALSRGVRFAAIAARGPVLDLSRPEDVPGVARRLASLEARP